VGSWIGAVALGLVLVTVAATPARAGGVRFSIGIGVPVVAAPYPVYPAYGPPAYHVYAPPVVYPPVAIGGFWYAGKGYDHHHRRPHHHQRHSRHWRH
jgi:hypothetical protein